MKDCIVAVLVGRRDHRLGMPVSGVAAGRPSRGAGCQGHCLFPAQTSVHSQPVRHDLKIMRCFWLSRVVSFSYR